MADKPRIEFEEQGASGAGDFARMDRLKAWFVEEVLPLEAVLIQFLSRGGRSRADVEDLRQELYTKVCAAARNELPHPTRPFVFTIARNLLIDRIRHEQVVAFDTVENLEDLNIAIDEPAPDRVVIARQELRRLQLSLDKLPERFRTAIIMRKVDGLSVREIAQRTGLAEKTVEKHLTEGMRALAHILYREAFDLGRPS
jgi:RNA polymerase sigma factor (sigma-70 family)